MGGEILHILAQMKGESIMGSKETIKMRTEAADILRELQDDPKVRNNDIVVGILKDAELECYREERQDRSKYTPKTRKNNPNRAQGVNDG